MKTVQMTLDNDLVFQVDRVVKELHTSRSAFTRKALQQALARVQQTKLETKHREGYLQKPVSQDEFNVWEQEQQWGDP